MKTIKRKYSSLWIWMGALVSIGWVMGVFTGPEIKSWYALLNRSSLTPPNHIFPVVWTLLYATVGTCGWFIWRASSPQLKGIKRLYVMQLILNWIWTPLFFHFHFVGFSLLILVLMVFLTSMMIFYSYKKIRVVSLLMAPYLFWILFASYLNFYIWQHNGGGFTFFVGS